MTRPGAAPAPGWSGLGIVVISLFATAFGFSVVRVLTPSVTNWIESFLHASESPSQALERVRGKEYAAAIGTISLRIPSRDRYGLADAVDLRDGGAFWVRYDLAPRRPLYLGSLEEVRRRPDLARELVAEGLWIVVAQPDSEPPELWTSADLESWLTGANAP